MSKSGAAVDEDGRGLWMALAIQVPGPQGQNYSGSVAQDDELSKGNLEKDLTEAERAGSFQRLFRSDVGAG